MTKVGAAITGDVRAAAHRPRRTPRRVVFHKSEKEVQPRRSTTGIPASVAHHASTPLHTSGYSVTARSSPQRSTQRSALAVSTLCEGGGSGRDKQKAKTLAHPIPAPRPRRPKPSAQRLRFALPRTSSPSAARGQAAVPRRPSGYGHRGPRCAAHTTYYLCPARVTQDPRPIDSTQTSVDVHGSLQPLRTQCHVVPPVHPVLPVVEYPSSTLRHTTRHEPCAVLHPFVPSVLCPRSYTRLLRCSVALEGRLGARHLSVSLHTRRLPSSSHSPPPSSLDTKTKQKTAKSRLKQKKPAWRKRKATYRSTHYPARSRCTLRKRSKRRAGRGIGCLRGRGRRGDLRGVVSNDSFYEQ
ncbi:hypothetical protein C8R45DRAFT_1155954 [Mycena sanguinolenta]|nr:hypothetical protein C8R45DRAFT_1155954 [Mycena sanguinolenta]